MTKIEPLKVPTFKPLLASEVEDVNQIVFPVLVSPKLDGIRALVRHGQLLTRSLKPVPNFYTQEMFRYFGADDGCLPDGELIVGHPTAKDVWNKTSSGVMSREGYPDVTYHVFDFHNANHWTFSERFERLSKFVEEKGHPSVKLVKHTRVDTVEELMTVEDTYVRMGYEGLMIRSMTGRYKYGRSTAREGILLKLKRFDDFEAEIIGFKEKMHNANEAKTNAIGATERSSNKENLIPTGTLGAFICKGAGPVGEFDVGSGYTAGQRIDFWNTRSSLIGKIVKVKYQGLTIDDKPRFPIFLGFRDRRDTSK